MSNIENRSKRLFGDVSLVALASIGLIALGLALDRSGFARFVFIVAACLGFAPLLRAAGLRLWGAITR